MNGKYKPALYELIEKGQLKPNRSGGMSTPEWFYTGKEKKNEVKSQNTTDSGLKRALKSDRIRLKVPNFTARMREKRLEISTNFWIVSLVGLALVLTHLTSFMIGKRGVDGTGTGTPTSLSAMVNIPAVDVLPEKKVVDRDDLAGIRQSLVRQNIFPQRKKSSRVTREAIARVAIAQKPAVKTEASIDRKTLPVAAALTNGDMCLIMCGHPDSTRALRPVQEYFNKRGIPVEIGRFQGRYVVYTRQKFVKQSGEDAVNLKEKIGRAGMEYNHNKPKGALGFGAETFAGAFAVNIRRIKNIDN